MVYFFGTLKALMLVVSIGLAFLGVSQVLRGVDVPVPLPKFSILNALEFGAGPIPSGLILFAMGVALFIAVTKWKIKYQEKLEEKPDGSRSILKTIVLGGRLWR